MTINPFYRDAQILADRSSRWEKLSKARTFATQYYGRESVERVTVHHSFASTCVGHDEAMEFIADMLGLPSRKDLVDWLENEIGKLERTR